jgi:hypothetical protein
MRFRIPSRGIFGEADFDPKYQVDWCCEPFLNHGFQDFQDFEEVYSVPDFGTV